MLAGYYSFIQEEKLLRDMYDFDVTMSYQIGNFDLSVRGNKLLHLRQNEWWQSTADINMYSSTLYRRMPGHLLLALRVKF